MTTSINLVELAVAGVQRLVPYQPGKPISEVQRELGLTRVSKLASNENPLGPGSKVLAAITQAAQNITRYPDGSGFALKAALASQCQLAPEQITLGNGSNELLELVARTFLQPGLAALFSQHAFAVYPLVTQAAGADAIVVPATDYSHDLDAMRAAITDATRVVFIANPNNPTGTWLEAKALENFISSLPASVICVLDEAYHEYQPETRRPHSSAWLAKYPNLLITRTFSKAYGLAGLRIGYSLSSPELAELLNRVRQPFNINSLALAAAEAALADDAHLQRSLQINRDGMWQLEQGFTELGLSWLPSAANFISVRVGDNAGVIYQQLLAKGVIVRPVANYQMPEFLRVSIGTAEENRHFLSALTALLKA
ncbi:MAG: histidinol-phosphate transaminase [Methylococcales bacterium]|nr:histidinol-phosphate transaminase [Methylococcales bacterium]